jgi:hypothetical protein
MSKHLSAKRCKQADYVRNLFVISPEFGTDLEDVLKPEYFAHVAPDLKPWSKIEVHPDDETYYAELLVRSSGRNWAVVSVLTKVDLAPKAEEVKPADGYQISWGGPHQKYRVIRLADKEVVSKEHTDAVAAQKWLGEHVKAMKV